MRLITLLVLGLLSMIACSPPSAGGPTPTEQAVATHTQLAQAVVPSSSTSAVTPAQPSLAPIAEQSDPPVLSTAEPASSGEWNTYQDPGYGFSFEYPAAYDAAEHSQQCGLRANGTEFSIGQRINLYILEEHEASLDHFAERYMGEKSQSGTWSIESRSTRFIDGQPALVYEYRYGGSPRFGSVAFLQVDSIMYIFNVTAGPFCSIPGNPISEMEAYQHMLGSFRIQPAAAAPNF